MFSDLVEVELLHVQHIFEHRELLFLQTELQTDDFGIFRHAVHEFLHVGGYVKVTSEKFARAVVDPILYIAVSARLELLRRHEFDLNFVLTHLV